MGIAVWCAVHGERSRSPAPGLRLERESNARRCWQQCRRRFPTCWLRAHSVHPSAVRRDPATSRHRWREHSRCHAWGRHEFLCGRNVRRVAEIRSHNRDGEVVLGRHGADLALWLQLVQRVARALRDGVRLPVPAIQNWLVRKLVWSASLPLAIVTSRIWLAFRLCSCGRYRQTLQTDSILG